MVEVSHGQSAESAEMAAFMAADSAQHGVISALDAIVCVGLLTQDHNRDLRPQQLVLQPSHSYVFGMLESLG